MAYQGRINQYTCRVCGQNITTIDRDYGTTPIALNCRATPDCPGMMFSSMYLVDQTLKPGYEWFKPKQLPKDRAMQQHIQAGGLDIRKIEHD